MSLAAVAVRNQRRRAAQQQILLADEAATQKSNNLDASDPNLKLRKVRHLFKKMRLRRVNVRATRKVFFQLAQSNKNFFSLKVIL